MTILALTAPTVSLGDPQLNAGTNLTTVVAGTTAMSANTGFTVPWSQGLMIVFLAPSGNTCTLTFAAGPNNSAVTTGSLTAADAYAFGPVSNAFANSSGLVAVNVTGTVTGAKVGAYLAPLATGTEHNPFELNPQSADY